MLTPYHILPATAKVWIYQASRKLDNSEFNEMTKELTIFCKNWTAHNQQLKASFVIEYHQIIILSVDESLSTASGCSIDKSVHFLKDIGKRYEIDFFNKMNLGYLENEELKTINFNSVNNAYKDGLVKLETPFLNYNITTLKDFKNWILPLSQHWVFNQLI